MSKKSIRKHWYQLKKPKKGVRNSFALVEVITETGKQRTVKDPQLEQINRSYKAGESLEKCTELAERVLQNHRDKEKPVQQVHTTENLNLLQDYWDSDYIFRQLSPKTKQGMHKRLENAVIALGTISLRTGTEEQVRNKLLKLKLPPTVYNEYVARLRQVFKHVGNPLKLKKLPVPKKMPTHISEAKLQQILPEMPEMLRQYAAVLFYSGMRASEAFGLSPESYEGDNSLHVAWQLTPQLELLPPKRGSIRHTYIYDEGLPYLEQWAKHDMRLIRNAFRWGEELEHWLGVDSYGLRHSYALHCLMNGVDPEWVIRAMGTSRKVFEDHYAGKVHTKATIQTMAAQLRLKKIGSK